MEKTRQEIRMTNAVRAVKICIGLWPTLRLLMSAKAAGRNVNVTALSACSLICNNLFFFKRGACRRKIVDASAQLSRPLQNFYWRSQHEQTHSVPCLHRRYSLLSHSFIYITPLVISCLQWSTQKLHILFLHHQLALPHTAVTSHLI